MVEDKISFLRKLNNNIEETRKEIKENRKILLWKAGFSCFSLFDTQISSVGKTLNGLMEKITTKVEEKNSFNQNEQKCKMHCQDIQKVILSTLSIKTTAWLAECKNEFDCQATNIIYCPKTTTISNERIDFLGREIDEGFRIAKFDIATKYIAIVMGIGFLTVMIA